MIANPAGHPVDREALTFEGLDDAARDVVSIVPAKDDQPLEPQIVRDDVLGSHDASPAVMRPPAPSHASQVTTMQK
jgi:hypothetical protein